ncbi:DUF1697 domain-containing protein [Arthrobacter sp. NPDC080073]|uniref:DUF1697 domain-containing protein n=1 Tax=Arthrobacter sp. NPDC080073 TaxID=3155919 RepID=UPI00341EE375
MLLRAVNAGVNSRITMASLRECVEETGISVLATYLPSGNLVIEAPRTSTARLAEDLGRAVGQRLGRPTPAVVLTGTQLDRVLREAPAVWREQPGHAHYVIFLLGSVTAAELLSGMEPEPDVEQITPAGRRIYWSVRTDASRSVLARVGRAQEYQHITVRTLSTLERMRELVHKRDPRTTRGPVAPQSPSINLRGAKETQGWLRERQDHDRKQRRRSTH